MRHPMQLHFSAIFLACSSTFTAASALVAQTATIIHLTDVHLDPFYVTGSVASCYCETHESCPRMPPSCGMATRPEDVAGPFGNSENDCATPPALWSSATTFLATEPSTAGAGWVFFTGDFGEAGLSAACGPPPLPTAEQQILDVVAHGMSSARALFPQARVFGVFGNHDAAPGDYFAGSADMAWLYGPLGAPTGAFGLELAEDAAALATLQAFGWYTTSLTPQTALLALNTNYWTIINPANSGNASAAGKLGEAQFAWLASTLGALAQANRTALVIGHIPPSPGAWLPTYFARYRALLTRFPIVQAQFFGHNHLDEFILVRACDPVPPPPTPYTGAWVETRNISWCSGKDLPVGDAFGRGTMPNSPHCPYAPPANGTAQGRIALCEGLCGNISECAGFTWYPDAAGPAPADGACCFRENCEDKPPSPGSTAECFEKAAPPAGCGGEQAPLHVLFVTPSLTEGYPASNPGLRAFSVDADTLAPLDVTTFWTNLSLANANWAPRWELEYSARAMYGLRDVAAASWAGLVERMGAPNSTEFAAFRRASVKNYNGPDAPGPCDDDCKRGVLAALNGTADA